MTLRRIKIVALWMVLVSSLITTPCSAFSFNESSDEITFTAEENRWISLIPKFVTVGFTTLLLVFSYQKIPRFRYATKQALSSIKSKMLGCWHLIKRKKPKEII